MSFVIRRNAATAITAKGKGGGGGGGKSQQQRDTRVRDEIIRIRRHFCMQELSKSLFEVGVTLGTGTFGRVCLCAYDKDEKSKGKKQYFALKILKKSEILRLKQVFYDFFFSCIFL